MNDKHYDIAIIGGGLAGLGLAIQLRRKGHSVVLFEKHSYPFHKVCGEYISMESFEFLRSLGVEPVALNASRITQLEVTTISGKKLGQELDPGGIGISRYLLDNELATIAGKEGVLVLDGTTVHSVTFNEDNFQLSTSVGEFSSRAAAGCYGKKSKLDRQWKRDATAPARKVSNYVGIKYHFRSSTIPGDRIYLHHFPGGYCGVSKVEGDRYCLCYLTTAEALSHSGNSIPELEKQVLRKNPFLSRVLDEVEIINEEPLVISQINFEKKSLVEEGVLMLGDAAGMITPLCGNGMSMALHASKMAAGLFDRFLEGSISRIAMEKAYREQWNQQFSRRLWVGRRVQGIFGKPALLSGLIKAGRAFPGITRSLVRQTHGKSF